MKIILDVAAVDQLSIGSRCEQLTQGMRTSWQVGRRAPEHLSLKPLWSVTFTPWDVAEAHTLLERWSGETR